MSWGSSYLTETEQYAYALLAYAHSDPSSSHHLGYPLHLPEPADNYAALQKNRGSARIGDIGRITDDGFFDRQFNIFEGGDMNEDGEVGRGVPEEFEFANIDREKDVRTGNNFGKDTIISTSGYELDGFDEYSRGESQFFRYRPTSHNGAILFLPNGATSSDLNSSTHPALRSYLLKHAHNFYEYLMKYRGRSSSGLDTLMLVTGRTVTNAWGLATFSCNPSSKEPPGNLCRAYFAAGKNEKEGEFCMCGWERCQRAGFRYGVGKRCLEEGETEGEGELIENQVVFLRGFGIAIRKPDDECAIGRGNKKYQTSNWARNQGSEGQSGWGWNWGWKPWLWSCFFSSPSAVTDEKRINSSTDSVASSTTPVSLELEEPEIIIDFMGGMPEPFHPSKPLNASLLEQNPDAKVAITHDDDWMSVIKENQKMFPDDSELIKRVRAKYDSKTESSESFCDG